MKFSRNLIPTRRHSRDQAVVHDLQGRHAVGQRLRRELVDERVRPLEQGDADRLHRLADAGIGPR